MNGMSEWKYGSVLPDEVGTYKVATGTGIEFFAELIIDLIHGPQFVSIKEEDVGLPVKYWRKV
jgi:hypothetical protein